MKIITKKSWWFCSPLGTSCIFTHFGATRGACSISNPINGRSTTPGATWSLGNETKIRQHTTERKTYDMMKCSLWFCYARWWLKLGALELVPGCFQRLQWMVMTVLMNGWQECVFFFHKIDYTCIDEVSWTFLRVSSIKCLIHKFSQRSRFLPSIPTFFQAGCRSGFQG